MPGRDGSGPVGAGPMTGRGMGYCTGYAGSGFGVRNFYGRGRGFRNRFFARRFGRGMGFGFYNPGFVQMSDEAEVDILKQQAEELSMTLKDIEQRIGELESQVQDKKQ